MCFIIPSSQCGRGGQYSGGSRVARERECMCVCVNEDVVEKLERSGTAFARPALTAIECHTAQPARARESLLNLHERRDARRLPARATTHRAMTYLTTRATTLKTILSMRP